MLYSNKEKEVSQHVLVMQFGSNAAKCHFITKSESFAAAVFCPLCSLFAFYALHTKHIN